MTSKDTEKKLFGGDLWGDPIEVRSLGELSKGFGASPFSVFNAREGWWIRRKKAWLSLGIRSEMGRGDNLAFGDAEIMKKGLNFYRDKTKAGKLGKCLPKLPSGDNYRLQKKYGKVFDGGMDGFVDTGDYATSKALQREKRQRSKFGKSMQTNIGAKYKRRQMNATSIFDPVLCELMYNWFCPPKGVVLDPFAGGSVRGIVASKLGLSYTGVELQAKQVLANIVQGAEICENDLAPPEWFHGDSAKISKLVDVEADFIFSCPPYFDLEVYSEDPGDISNMEWEDFLKAYQKIIKKSLNMLKPDRFAVFVVGDVRDSEGYYRGIPYETIRIFEEEGAYLYNEAILLTMVGTLPIRVTKFGKNRKLGKAHQNIMIFVKGDWKKAVKVLRKGKLERAKLEFVTGQ